MQNLWCHPMFEQLQQEKPFCLLSESLYGQKRLKALSFEMPHWQMSMVHHDFDEGCFQQLTLLAVNRQALNWMHAMQQGQLVNSIEGIDGAVAALHTAVRDEGNARSDLARSVQTQALAQRNRIEQFLRSHTHFQTLVVLGIGGSQLGPEAVYEALKLDRPEHKNVFFAPSLDPASHRYLRQRLSLKHTLVAAISKSGSTLETLEGEKLWRGYFQEQGLDSKEHMVSITTPKSRLDRTDDYAACFYFDPSIGGRYSVSSSVGALPIAFAFGMSTFEQFLSGAHQMDQHALIDDRSKNGPLALACASIWHRQIMKRSSQAVIAYKQGLHRFAAHLQQLEMESLGKRTDRTGREISASSGALIWGETGTCSQHSFFQWLHQGTDIVPIDFIAQTGLCAGSEQEREMSEQLLANALAQSLALARGHKATHPSKDCPGARPSTFLTTPVLDATSLGALVSLYEHKTAFEGFILGINPFDQEGVELGKKMAQKTYAQLKNIRSGHMLDSSVDWNDWLKQILKS